MLASKRVLLSAATALIIGLSAVSVTLAQIAPPGAKGNKKSYEAGTITEGEAYMIGAGGHRVHKSHGKVTAAQHEAAIKKGAREVKAGAVIYNQGGKLYMVEDTANEKASQYFQDQFQIDY
jgi:hypothetical protein